MYVVAVVEKDATLKGVGMILFPFTLHFCSIYFALCKLIQILLHKYSQCGRKMS